MAVWLGESANLRAEMGVCCGSASLLRTVSAIFRGLRDGRPRAELVSLAEFESEAEDRAVLQALF